MFLIFRINFFFNADLHGREEVLEVLLVRLAVNDAASALVEVEILLRTHQPKFLALFLTDQ